MCIAVYHRWIGRLLVLLCWTKTVAIVSRLPPIMLPWHSCVQQQFSDNRCGYSTVLSTTTNARWIDSDRLGNCREIKPEIVLSYISSISFLLFTPLMYPSIFFENFFYHLGLLLFIPFLLDLLISTRSLSQMSINVPVWITDIWVAMINVFLLRLKHFER